MSAPAQMGPVARVGNIFFGPGEVFEDVRRSPRDWWLPLVLLIVVASAAGVVFRYRLNLTPEVLAQAAIETGLERQGKTEKDLTDQERQAVDTQRKVTEFMIRLGPALNAAYFVIFFGVSSLVYWVILLVAQMKTTFFRVLSVVSYSYFAPNLIKFLLSIVYAFLVSPDNVDSKTFMSSGGLLTTSLSFLTSMKDHPALWTLLNWIDVFSIWFLVLLAFGFGAIALKRRKFGSTIVLAAVPYVLMILISAGFAAAFSK